MSKKSTSRTGNDGDGECSSANGRSSSSEKSKSNLRPHLSDKEDATATSTSTYIFNSKIMTPNSSKFSENHTTEVAKNHKSALSSPCSLAGSLYGSEGDFSRNLEYLKHKLRLLNVFEHDDPSASQKMRLRLDAPSDTHSCNTESSCDGKSDYKERPKGYLSTRETYINLLSPLGKFKERETSRNEYHNCVQSSNSPESHCTTIYKAPQFCETDNTGSAESCNIPVKKLCHRENDIKNIQSGCLPEMPLYRPENKKTNSEISTTVSENAPYLSQNTATYSAKYSTKPNLTSASQTLLNKTSCLNQSHSPLPASSSLKMNYISMGTSPVYLPPIKRKCIRNRMTSKSLAESNSENNKLISASAICTRNSDIRKSRNQPVSPLFLPPSEGNSVDVSSGEHTTNSEQKCNSESLIFSDTIELGLNLPSSLIGDCTSSDKTTPLEPRIVVIDSCSKKSERLKRKNRIAPISECPSSASSTPKTIWRHTHSCKRGDSSISSEELYKKSLHLYKTYCEDTSEISSNTGSSPSCRVSTCTSQTSISPSATTEGSPISITKYSQTYNYNQNDVQDNETSNKCLQEELVDPLSIGSLDVPKFVMRVYNFPAVTRIIKYSGNTVGVSCAGDWSDSATDEKEQHEKTHVKSDSCYKDKAQFLLNSPSLSPRKFSHQKTVEFNNSISSAENITLSNTSEGGRSKDYTSKRKIQSTKLSFYSVPSTELDEEFVHLDLDKNDSEDSNAEEVNTSCVCCGIFFPKKRKGFFT